jgi:hypothetical protein
LKSAVTITNDGGYDACAYVKKDLMKRSHRPRKTADLTEPVHHQLNMYAIAAGAAGVGVLALAQPVEAKIVYTPAHRVIGPDSSYLLDLNHDGITDFTITNIYNCPDSCVSSIAAKPANGTHGVEGQRSLWAYALKAGAIIGPKRPFSASVLEFAGSGICHPDGSHWCNLKRYLGLSFKIHGKTHYGWARISMGSARGRIKALLLGYAYETIAGKAIIAGATSGPDDAEPAASLNTPTPEPASLGALALGSPGLSIWRRKEHFLGLNLNP